MSPTPTAHPHGAARGRDTHLGRVTRVTGWVAAGSLALAGALSAVAANAFPGRASASTGTAPAQAGSGAAGPSSSATGSAGTAPSASTPATSAPATDSPPSTDGGQQSSSGSGSGFQAPTQAPVPSYRAPMAVSGGS